jgi:hypothetical protein
MSTCLQCDQPGIFGYRDKNTGEMAWYCTTHQLGQDWADARRDQRRSIHTAISGI